MANPQKENGFIPLSKELNWALARISLTEGERKVLACIFDKTYGWQKKAEKISIKEFIEFTGIDRRTVCRSIKSLLKRGVVGRDPLSSRMFLYKVQKDYDLWKKDTIGRGQLPSMPDRGQSPPILGGQLPPTNRGQRPPTLYNKEIKRNKEALYRESAERVIVYFNELTGSKFKPKGKSIRTMIVSRLREGYTEGDCKEVINNKFDQWKNDPKMCKYIRPSTLFRPTKFEEYVNEKEHEDKEILEKVEKTNKRLIRMGVLNGSAATTKE